MMDLVDKMELRRVFNLIKEMNPDVVAISFDKDGVLNVSLSKEDMVPADSIWQIGVDVTISDLLVKTIFNYDKYWKESLTKDILHLKEGGYYEVTNTETGVIGVGVYTDHKWNGIMLDGESNLTATYNELATSDILTIKELTVKD